MPLGETQDSDLDIFAEFELRRTNKVADILDEEQPGRIKRKFPEYIGDHACVKMAGPARIYLHNRHSEPVDALCIVGPHYVTFDNAKFHVTAEGFDSSFKQRRFTCSRRTYEIDYEDTPLVRRTSRLPSAIRSLAVSILLASFSFIQKTSIFRYHQFTTGLNGE